jgi:hypothetical protein
LPWDAALEARCTDLAALAAAPGGAAAWRELLVVIAPEIEAWAARHPTLRRWGLAGQDDVRAVLVRVLERLAANHRASLAEYTARRAPAGPDDTPFRAWLRVNLRYAVGDHLRDRLGWVAGKNRRDLGSQAPRLSQVTEPGQRPALTDRLILQQQWALVQEQLGALPDEMAEALRLWASGAHPDAIATTLRLADATTARRLVRAATARLRHRLRATEADHG